MTVEYEMEWDRIVSTIAFDVYSFELSGEGGAEIETELFECICNIFGELKRMSRGRFFKRRELSAFWLILRNDIVNLHEMGVEYGALLDIYVVIDELFEAILRLNEKMSDYECADNLLKFKEDWFKTFGVKIIRECEE